MHCLSSKSSNEGLVLPQILQQLQQQQQQEQEAVPTANTVCTSNLLGMEVEASGREALESMDALTKVIFNHGALGLDSEYKYKSMTQLFLLDPVWVEEAEAKDFLILRDLFQCCVIVQCSSEVFVTSNSQTDAIRAERQRMNKLLKSNYWILPYHSHLKTSYRYYYRNHNNYDECLNFVGVKINSQHNGGGTGGRHFDLRTSALIPLVYIRGTEIKIQDPRRRGYYNIYRNFHDISASKTYQEAINSKVIDRTAELMEVL